MPPPRTERTAVLTVGSTHFTPLVLSALSPSSLSALSAHSITSLLAQIGTSSLPPSLILGTQEHHGLRVEIVRFKSEIEERVGSAEIVVSHAGAGSILSFLRPSASSTPPGRRHLILVPNTTLMDSHQSDLADEMRSKGWAEVCTPADLPATLSSLSPSTPSSAPPLNPHLLNTILNQTAGFPYSPPFP